MFRAFTFFLLVIAAPAAVFWWTHKDEPRGALRAFVAQLEALFPASAAPDAPHRPAEPPAEPEPESGEPDGEAPAPPLRDDPARLLEAGRFEDAAQGLPDGAERDFARLGAALARAFPASLPDGPYGRVTTRGGQAYEGVLTDAGGEITVTPLSGTPVTLPRESVVGREETSRDVAIGLAADATVAEGKDGNTRGPRLFALIQQAFTIGRPDAVPALLRRALAEEDQQAWFLRAIESRVPASVRAEVYRAYAATQSEPPPAARPKITAPESLGGRPRPHESESTRDPEVMALLREASPLRTEGQRLYRKALTAGRDANAADVEEAIRKLDAAAALYEKAVLLEDADDIHALLRHCSRLTFQLRFWRQQLTGR